MRLPGFARFRGLFIVAATVSLCLLAGEYAARFVFQDVTTTSHDSYFTRRWLRTVVKNSWGFRERQFDLAKPTGVFRIAIIGDSITFGQGIDVVKRFSNVLENRLNLRSKQIYEVLNFGRRGAETGDEVRFLSHPVLDAKPDFIVLQWFYNDVEGTDKTTRPAPYPLIPSKFLMSLLLRKSILFFLLNEQWTTLQWRLGLLQSYDDYMLMRFGNSENPSVTAAKSALREFIAMCKKSNIPVGIVLFDPDPTFNFLADRVVEQCNEEAILCLDLRDTFTKHRPDRASRFDPHPGPAANQLIAARLLQTFGEIWSILSRSR